MLHRITTPLPLVRSALSIPALLLLLLSVPLPLRGQGFDLEWMRLYGGHEQDVFTAVLPCDDGGYLAAGATESYRAFFAQTKAAYVVRFGVDGDPLWSRALSAFDIHTVDGLFRHPSGGWLLVGSVAALKPATGFRLWIARLDTAGRIVTESRIDSVVAGSRPTLTAGGSIVLLTSVKDTLLVSSLTPEGALEWTRRVGRPPTATRYFPRGVVPLRTGGVVVMEELFEGIPLVSARAGFHRYSESGELLQERFLDTLRHMIAVAQDSTDGLVVLTTIPVDTPTSTELVPTLFVLDTNGLLRAGPFVHDGLPSMFAQAMAVDSRGQVVVTGSCASAEVKNVIEIFVGRITADLQQGTFRSFPQFNLPALNGAGIAILDDGVVICGWSSYSTSENNALLLRLREPE